MKNIRIDRENETLEVVGEPVQNGTILAGHLLVCVDGDRSITMSDGCLWCGADRVATLPGGLCGIHRVGPLLVVTTTAGMLYLASAADGYRLVDIATALPSLSLTQQNAGSITASIPAIAFASPYDTWQAPLAQPDVAALTAGMRTAWNTITARAQAAGMYFSPLRVRCGVRLWDDSYLWLSEPVTLGAETASNAPRVTVDVTVGGSGNFIGVPEATLTLPTFTLGIAVNNGVGEHWRNMVKAVDVLATAPVAPVQSTAVIDYRCLTTSSGARRAVLDYGFIGITSAQMTAQLDRSSWTVIDTCTDLDALSQGKWTSSLVLPSITLTAAQCAAVSLPATRSVVASLLCNGRLYVADDTGLMTTSLAGNPLVVERECVVTGARLLSIAPVPRALYSGGFGRYPVYLFTDEGIFALPLTAQGVYGEPRLLDRTIIADGCRPIEADRDIYFTSWRGNLCRLRASTVTTVLTEALVEHMAWDDVHHELWCIDAAGDVFALLKGGERSERTLVASHLYNDLSHALAVTYGGAVLDLTAERQAMMEVEWVSEPTGCSSPLRSIVWHVYGDDVRLRLDVLGERGVSCHGFLVNRVEVTGRVGAPIVVPLFAPPLRTMRRRISGQAASGTLLADRC